MVRLRVISGDEDDLVNKNFNSKMVRLRDATGDFLTHPDVFQFQDGAIKGTRQHNRLYLLSYFNSKMVRLRGYRLSASSTNKSISIPRWCD